MSYCWLWTTLRFQHGRFEASQRYFFLRLLLVFRAICGNTFAACGFCMGYYHLTSCERDVFLLASRWETYHCIFLSNLMLLHGAGPTHRVQAQSFAVPGFKVLHNAEEHAVTPEIRKDTPESPKPFKNSAGAHRDAQEFRKARHDAQKSFETSG